MLRLYSIQIELKRSSFSGLVHILHRLIHLVFHNLFTEINECSPNPCQNGAKCVHLNGSYRCDCKAGYKGKNCETG